MKVLTHFLMPGKAVVLQSNKENRNDAVEGILETKLDLEVYATLINSVTTPSGQVLIVNLHVLSHTGEVFPRAVNQIIAEALLKAEGREIPLLVLLPFAEKSRKTFKMTNLFFITSKWLEVGKNGSLGLMWKDITGAAGVQYTLSKETSVDYDSVPS